MRCLAENLFDLVCEGKVPKVGEAKNPLGQSQNLSELPPNQITVPELGNDEMKQKLFGGEPVLRPAISTRGNDENSLA